MRVGQGGKIALSLVVGSLSIYPAVNYADESHIINNSDTQPVDGGAVAPKKSAVKFNRGFANAYNEGTDFSIYDGEPTTQPGEYFVEVTRNKKTLGTHHIKFVKDSAGNVEPCLSAEMLLKMDVNPETLPLVWQNNACILIKGIIPGATTDYDTDDEILQITIPQRYLNNNPEGYINPMLWDEGVPSFSASYNVSATSTQYDDHTSSNYYYGSLLSSLKWGAWRLYTYDNINTNDETGTQWSHLSSYVQRAVIPLKAELTAGDINTTGSLFDTVALRGVSLMSDERMLPQSLQGYAPVVRGVADTNARITIKQNGNLIREMSVPPGEFVIDDLYATGYGGDLEVTINESNGKTRTFITPYASLPMLLRPGTSKFSATAGEVRSESLRHTPVLMEGTYQYGLNNTVTVYGGGQITAPGDYAALMGGMAINTPLGALGIDLTRSFTSFEDEQDNACDSICNLSLKVSLAKYIDQTGTNLSLAGYRYSSQNYYSLMDALLTAEAQETGDDSFLPENYRDKIEVNISQSLAPGWGSVFASGYYGRVWDSRYSRNTQSSYQFGYSNSWRSVSYSVNLSKTIDEDGIEDRAIYLGMSVPFGTLHTKVPTLNAAVSYSNQDAKLRASLYGNAGEYNQFDYGTWFDYAQEHQTNFGFNMGYNGSRAQGNISYSQTETSYTGSINASGAVVVHGGGVNFSSSLGNTFGIVEAKGAAGARIYPELTSTVSDNGYAIISSLSPYQYNEIYVEAKGAPIGVEFGESKLQTVPTAGASVKIKLDTKSTSTQFIQINRVDGKYIPYGATIKNEGDEVLGIVGQGGRAMLSLPQDKISEKLRVSWTSGKEKGSCFIDYKMDKTSSTNSDEDIPTQHLMCKK
ncbi:fimbrial biogenesis outer membrane usher protein [Chimaeribacter arupi]|uniref:fimbria/pilus outer membrane usher protein n=1 Tax=Chimaeribacter arupi TaxID=2060066 RepID=UPI0027120DEC|nr:fimbria/pilus outer membrane usher protein [Chimaeribacter arupi]WKZ92888.1 fimbrial biogenesis outer membrane usher protein [Chimaeribacter arupi]